MEKGNKNSNDWAKFLIVFVVWLSFIIGVGAIEKNMATFLLVLTGIAVFIWLLQKLDKWADKETSKEKDYSKIGRTPVLAVKCSKCGSEQITANKKGFGIGKALIGGLAVGIPGVLAGNIGKNDVTITCLKCGHKWKPGRF